MSPHGSRGILCPDHHYYSNSKRKKYNNRHKILALRVFCRSHVLYYPVCIFDMEPFPGRMVDCPDDTINLTLDNYRASGPTGCIIEGFITIVAEGISLLSLTAVTLDRYLIVIVRKPISLKMCTFMILCIWVAFPILCCYVFYFGVAGKVVGLGKSNFTCVVAVRIDQ